MTYIYKVYLSNLKHYMGNILLVLEKFVCSMQTIDEC